MCVASVKSDSPTPWTVAHRAPLSVDFPGKNPGGGAIFSFGHLPDPGIEPTCPVSPALQAGSVPTEPRGKPPCAVWAGAEGAGKAEPSAGASLPGRLSPVPVCPSPLLPSASLHSPLFPPVSPSFFFLNKVEGQLGRF